MFKAIFWDFGGVFTSSPFAAFRRYEQEHGLPRDFIRGVNSRDSDHNAWARFERNDIDLAQFDRLFEQETRTAGHAVPGRIVVELLYGELRPVMVAALRYCKQQGLRNACLTNNMRFDDSAMAETARRRAAVFDQVSGLFDEIIESSRVGVRKPDPQFYRIACGQLAVTPQQVVFLDDLGINLKPARALGMTTIKVTDPMEALRELETVLELPLLQTINSTHSQPGE
jgi:putative hydrolase of the HAD superfamily